MIFTLPGSSASAWLLSSTSPLTGEYTSLAACNRARQGFGPIPTLMARGVKRLSQH